ncbi:WYL domain-containing protein [Oscillatoria laete-virens NRMC-F 0139]|nr:WYL domain-containing protein [Oscillatoria laete-virens]MDL5052346.1 WYL domain-containing protein [Oscillatoria laete-virens NRMC-F 0139]
MKASPLVPLSRPPLERMILIHNLVREGKFPNCRSLAHQVEVSEKTIQRDIDFMKDRMNLPLAYDQYRYGYYYSRPVNAFPSMHVTEGEMVALFVARKAMEQYRGTRYEKPLKVAFEKICANMTDYVSFSWDDLDAAVSFRPLGKSEINERIFQTVTAAILERRQLDIEYKKLGATRFEKRTVHPLHVACIDNQWYLFAFDPARNDIRTFSLTRFKSATMLTRKFPAREFSLPNHLKDSFGVTKKKARAQRVRIVFDDWAAQVVKERHWHPSQFIQELDHGRVEVILTLSDLNEVTRWVLSWCGHARVLEPRELKTAVAQAARRQLGK